MTLGLSAVVKKYGDVRSLIICEGVEDVEPRHDGCSSRRLRRRQLKEKGEMAGSRRTSFFIIFRYADWLDILLVLMGTFGAIGDGVLPNCLLIYVSKLFNSLGNSNSKQNQGNFMNGVEKCSLYFVYLGLAVTAVAFMEGYCWSKTSERQVLKIRYKYLEAVLRQEVGFFDSQEATTSEIINSISKEACLIQEVLRASMVDDRMVEEGDGSPAKKAGTATISVEKCLMIGLFFGLGGRAGFFFIV
ncbi:ABC transporter B family member 8 [Olea europaea subsp. europaea]|uniref:ABC transporter B family member 8 n=1 Tax=Olea europaea subsp. europaea TaxID=158383 RepID=A0A8S0U7B5_OLEEU|nr:ABC transporter B family member 8 [Olea europaea subsp. europaea]